MHVETNSAVEGDDIFASNVAKAFAFVLVGAGCWAVLPTIGKSILCMNAV